MLASLSFDRRIVGSNPGLAWISQLLMHLCLFPGWLGYSDELVTELCKKYLKLGFTHFKVKVGKNLDDDIRRCTTVRKNIGYDKVMVSRYHVKN